MQCDIMKLAGMFPTISPRRDPKGLDVCCYTPTLGHSIHKPFNCGMISANQVKRSRTHTTCFVEIYHKTTLGSMCQTYGSRFSDCFLRFASRQAIQSLASTNRLIRNQNYSSIIENQESQKSNPTQLKSNQYTCTVKLLCIPLL